MKKVCTFFLTVLLMVMITTNCVFAEAYYESPYRESSEDNYRFLYTTKPSVGTLDVGQQIISQNGEVQRKYLFINETAIVSYSVYNFLYFKIVLENADKDVTDIMVAHNRNNERKCYPRYSSPRVYIDSLIEISENAFKDCRLLENFETEPIAYYVDKGAFENCTSLKYIHFAQDKNYTDLGIRWVDDPQESWNADKGTYIREGYYVTDGVTYTGNIESNAFVNCPSLRAVVIDNPDMTIQPNAFVNCPNLIIYCKTGSKAEEYAKQNSIPFINTDKADDFDRMVFDYDLFAEKNPEIAANFNGNEEAALAYWLNVGIAKNMTGSHVFDGEYYLVKNADVAKACDNDVVKGYNHFKLYGCNELRKSSFEYCGKAYKQRHSDLSAMTGEQLVKHYVTYGIDEKRNARDEIAVKQSYGDADLDGCITSADASIVMQKALNNGFGIVTDVKYIDVDGDGIITAADASTILQKVRNNGFKMPVEG